MHSWREKSKEIFYKNKQIRKETQQKRDAGKKTRMFALGEEVKINNWNGGLSFWRTIICFKETVQRTEGYTGEKKKTFRIIQKKNAGNERVDKQNGSERMMQEKEEQDGSR